MPSNAATIDKRYIIDMPADELMKAGPDFLRRMRAETPVAYLRSMDLWLLTGTKEFQSTLSDQEHFWTYLPENLTVALGKVYIQGDITPDQYSRIRKGGDAALNARAMQKSVNDLMLPMIDANLDRIEQSGVKKFDAFDDLFSQMNFDVMKNILGLPHVSNTTMKWWFDVVNEGFENFTSDPVKIERAHKVSTEIDEAILPTCIEKEANPDNSLISHMLKLAEGETFDERRTFIMGHIKNLLVAGAQEGAHTCVNALIGLNTSPEDMEKFRVEPAKYASLAVEETVRWMPPAAYIHRCVKKAVTLNGVFLDVGSDLILSSYAANLDPTLWGDDAEQFVLERFAREKSHRHTQLGFGQPPRFCPGSPFIRSFVPSALTRTFERFPSLRPDPDHEWRAAGSMFSNFWHFHCVID